MTRLAPLRAGKPFIKLQIRGVAEYPGQYKRGTESILASPHFKDVRTQYSRKNLRSGFYGPREWYFFARNKMREANWQNAVKVASDITQHEDSYPAGYPFISEAMRASDGSIDFQSGESEAVKAQRQEWEQFRRACANVHHASPYAIEERIIDSWNYFCEGKESSLDIHQVMYHGGMLISLTDKYRRQQPALIERPADTSDHVYQTYSQLHAHCNPWSSSDLPAADLIRTLTQSEMTKADVEQLLPEIVQRWRWLTMGHMNTSLGTPDSALSDALVSMCCQAKSPETALHMIRHKSVFKLSPSIAAFEELMGYLAERHLNLCLDQENHVASLVEPPAPPKPAKRRVSKRDYPFRQGPRFYFYRQLPFVLNPEPSQFAEFALPTLSRDNDTKRILPDDQRKKLHLMMEEAESQHYEVQESKAVASLTDMYRLAYYMTDSSPVYYSTKATPLIHDLLLVAGVLGRTTEGWTRAREIYLEISSQPKGPRITKSGLAALCIGNELNEAKVFDKAEKYLALRGIVGDAEDSLKIGFLSGVYALKSTHSGVSEHGLEQLVRDFEYAGTFAQSANPSLTISALEATKEGVDEVFENVKAAKRADVVAKCEALLEKYME